MGGAGQCSPQQCRPMSGKGKDMGEERGHRTEGASEAGSKVPAFGYDVGLSMQDGMFFVSKRSDQPGGESEDLYKGKVLDISIIEQISTSREEEQNIRGSSFPKKTLRIAVLLRWLQEGKPAEDDKPEVKAKMSEWTTGTITVRASAQYPLICAMRAIRKVTGGADGGVAVRLDLRNCRTKKVGSGQYVSTVVDGDTGVYTVFPKEADPPIPAALKSAAADWLRDLRSLRDGTAIARPSAGNGASPSAANRQPGQDDDIPF